MKFLLLILAGGCEIENRVEDPCDEVEGYLVCEIPESYTEALRICSDHGMVLADPFVDDFEVDLDYWEELNFLGEVSFEDPWWVGSDIYECTIMADYAVYPTECREEHPFICEG